MRVGSLFTGIGGLELGLGTPHPLWMVEKDEQARQVLGHNHPGTPVFADIKEVDFSSLPPVDILVGGGFPCQPFSQAGKRKGKDDDRYLWPEVARAVDQLRPGLVFLENVRGIMFPRNRQTYGEIIGSLADIGYDIRWGCLRASEAGAPHRRDRWFAVAYPWGLAREKAREFGPRGPWLEKTGVEESRRSEGEAVVRVDGGDSGVAGPEPLMPTPMSRDWKGPARDQITETDLTTPRGSGGASSLPDAARYLELLPTPVARDDGKSVDAHLEMKDRLGNRKAITSLAVLARANFEQPLLPTPVRSDAHGSRRSDEWTSNDGTTITDAIWQSDLGQNWGRYEPAIRHWEQVLGRPAPHPTIRSKTLSAAFVEWMMGFPAGLVTDVPDLSNSAMLKMLGNAVVPQQARLAYSLLLS